MPRKTLVLIAAAFAFLTFSFQVAPISGRFPDLSESRRASSGALRRIGSFFIPQPDERTNPSGKRPGLGAGLSDELNTSSAQAESSENGSGRKLLDTFSVQLDRVIQGSRRTPGNLNASIAVCSSKACFTRANCAPCSLYGSKIQGITLFVVRSGKNLPGTLHARDLTDRSEISFSEIREAQDKVFHSPFPNPRFNEDYVLRIDDGKVEQEVSFRLDLDAIPVPECLKLQELAFGLCPAFKEKKSHFGKAEINLKGFVPCSTIDPKQPIRKISRAAVYQDGCEASWFAGISRFMREELVMPDSTSWYTDLSSLFKGTYALRSPGQSHSKSLNHFLVALHEKLAGGKPRSYVRAYQEPKQLAWLSQGVEFESELGTDPKQELPDFAREALAPRLDSLAEKKGEVWVSFLPPSNGAPESSPLGDACENDLDCQSSCCREGRCEAHFPEKGLYCRKAPGESCLGTEFCSLRLRYDKKLVKTPKYKPGTGKTPCSFPPTPKKSLAFDHCVDAKCVEIDDSYNPYPLQFKLDPATGKLDPIKMQEELIRVLGDPANCADE